MDITILPHINVFLNSLSLTLILIAFGFIRIRRETWHRRLMLAAGVTSVVFLISYLTYHFTIPEPRHYIGSWPYLYFPMLISHVILAALIVPLVLVTIYRGLTDKRVLHKRLAKITFPLWVYVSATGILIYLSLY